MLAIARFRSGARFSRESDWLRLVLLGLVLLILGVLATSAGLALRPVPGSFGGEVAILGGAAVALLVVKIARTAVYIDWMLNGLFSIAAGFVLQADRSLGQLSSLILIFSFLLASGLARIWIGLVHSPPRAANWMLSSGCIAVLASVWIAGSWILNLPTRPPLILAIDTFFQGLSIAGFGFALKEGR